MSISEASEIVAGCKRLEKENWRWARWELQKWFSMMQVDSALSTTARPFEPQIAPQSSNEDDGQPVYPPRSGWSGSHPTLGLVPSSPVGRTSFSHPLSLALRQNENRTQATDSGLSQLEAFPPLSLDRCDIAREHDIMLPIKGKRVHALEALHSDLWL